MIGPPKEISGAGELAAWSRMLLRFLRSITLVDGPGYRIKRLPGGYSLVIDTQPGRGGAGGLVGPFHIKSVQSDYLTCVTWDGTNEGTNNVYIAKDWKLRNSLGSEIKGGITHNYTYQSAVPPALDANNVQRTDSWTQGGTAMTETQLVSPPWVVSSMVGGHWVGDLIWAAPATTLVKDASNNAIGLLLVGTRAWTD